jgi:flagellar hook-associated protein 1 FlgK
LGYYAGEIGTGVVVDHIRRSSLDFFDTRYRNQVSDARRWELESGILKQVEATMAETGSDGLVAKLDAFWEGWRNLAMDPSDPTLKADVLERSKILAGSITTRYTQLTQIQKDQNLGIVQRVDEINAKAEQIAKLNMEIAHMLGNNQQPNDLLDQRDLLVDDLAALTGSRSDLQPNGMVIVSVGGHTLVGGPEFSRVKATQGALTTDLTWESDGQAFVPTTGELAGLLDLAGAQTPPQKNVIQTYHAALDQLAGALISQVNATFNPTNAAGLNFFQDDGTATQGDSIQVNPAMNNLNNILSGMLPGDNTIPVAVAALKNTAVASLGGIRMNEFYTQKTAELGLFTKQAIGYSKDKNLVLKALGDQRDSLEGVSLDEEAANLMKSQKAFEAAARMVNVMDDMLDRIINGMGLVGR